MTTEANEALQFAYTRLTTDEFGAPPLYLAEMLIAALPELTADTVMHCRVTSIDRRQLQWQVWAADGGRLLRMNVVGPPAGYLQGRLQADTQSIVLQPLRDSVSAVAITVYDTTPDRGNEVTWSTEWTFTFVDGETLTIPTGLEGRRQASRDEVTKFAKGFIAAALPSAV